jgi:DNA-binding response OmpR family regulator
MGSAAAGTYRFSFVTTVLAVDDDPDVLALLEVTLQRGGHHVELAAGADEALRILRDRVIDLVLIDVMMPGRDGWSLLEEIKADPELSRIPAVMVTARAEPQDQVRGGLGGALSYITKPFHPQELLDAVTEVLHSETPEAVRRREVQRMSLQKLASLESGREGTGPRPRISSLANRPESLPTTWESVVANLERLTTSQRRLVADLARGRSVSRVAAERRVSRSNVYASIRRIHRKLGTQSVAQLLELARESGLEE